MSATDKYTAWIDREYDTEEKCLGQCHAACTRIVLAFPELRIRAGYALTGWGLRAHWWTVDPVGTVVDPTARQFPLGKIFEYVEWHPGDKVAVGPCANCGEEIWIAVDNLNEEPVRPTCCGPACERDYIRYLEQGM